jgi:hypothetical protein
VARLAICDIVGQAAASCHLNAGRLFLGVRLRCEDSAGGNNATRGYPNRSEDRTDHMRTFVIVAAGLVVPAVSAVAAPPVPRQENGWLIYQDSYTTLTIPCGPQPVLLYGSHTTITLRGVCAYVRVAGAHNDIGIDIGPAGTIEITGAHNDVTWQQVQPGPPPRLIDGGYSNSFHRP